MMSVYMFPGQGSQVKGMGADLFASFPELTETTDRILGYSVRELCLEDPQRQLGQTRYTQPALYVINALSYRRCLHEHGAPAYVLGHSLGEYNALEAAGVIGFEDGLRLVRKRGELMSEAPPGAMAAVIGLDEAAIGALLGRHGLDAIDIANLNGPSQTIISGLKEDIVRAAPLFEAEQARFVPLNTSGAFHSRYMAAARQAFAAYLGEFHFNKPRIPVISNVEAQPYALERVAELLAAQITRPVQWSRSIHYLLALGQSEFLELGPGQVLTRLLVDIRKHAPAVAASPAVAPTPVAVAAASTAPSVLVYDRERELRRLQQRIDDWNRRYPVGTRVQVDRYQQQLVTRTPAMSLFGHRAAIYLEGYNGYFELADVHPLHGASA
ncbi:MAG: ACP S-malonyltransferase [Burkholderia sp.]